MTDAGRDVGRLSRRCGAASADRRARAAGAPNARRSIRRRFPIACWWKARISIRIRSSVPTASSSRGCSGTIPNMPWDGTELWVGAFNASGLIGVREKVAGGASESIFQPEWSPDGALYFVSDRTGWWNLYRWPLDVAKAAVEAMHARWRRSSASRSGRSAWSRYAFVSAHADGGHLHAERPLEAGDDRRLYEAVHADRSRRAADRVASSGRRSEATERGTEIYFVGGSRHAVAGDHAASRQAGTRRPAIIDHRIDSARVDLGCRKRSRSRSKIATCTRFTTRRRIPMSTRASQAMQAAAARDHAWRSDGRDDRCARSEDPVLDQPRLRGARRRTTAAAPATAGRIAIA